MDSKDEHRLAAAEILRRNDRGGYTVPNGAIYPFQWNWDSAFVALGFAELDISRAWQEIETLFLGQWADGFVPHIVFWQDDAGYFPGPERWQANGAQTGVPTSGITQPPVAATVVRRIFEKAPSRLAHARLANLFPRIFAWHRWFAANRDFEGKGVCVAVHPWETGRDNSPEWDQPGERIDTSRIAPYTRRDTDHLDAAMRPRHVDYDRYVALVDHGRSCGWDHAAIAQTSPFRVADVGLSMILLRANRDLLELARLLGRTGDAREIAGWIARSEDGLAWLWNDELDSWCSRDTVDAAFCPYVTSASFLSFYAGLADPDRDRAMVAHLEQMGEQTRYLVPSLAPWHSVFEPARYWRGPVWAVLNLMIGLGLEECGQGDLAQQVRSDTAELIAKGGFSEAFSPLDGVATGGQNFSWTAAVYLHWAKPE